MAALQCSPNVAYSIASAQKITCRFWRPELTFAHLVEWRRGLITRIQAALSRTMEGYEFAYEESI